MTCQSDDLWVHLPPAGQNALRPSGSSSASSQTHRTSATLAPLKPMSCSFWKVIDLEMELAESAILGYEKVTLEARSETKGPTLRP